MARIARRNFVNPLTFGGDYRIVYISFFTISLEEEDMFAMRLLEEGGNQGGIGWLVWVVLVIFLVMVVLGWWVSRKGWLKKEEEPKHEEAQHVEAPVKAAEPVSFSVETAASAADDLTVLEGIGPKVAKLLAGIGITTFKQLAEADMAKLRAALDGAGYKYMEPAGWVEQAALAAKGDKDGLAKLQGELKGGRKVA
jgi:predicted flap endonuclease-1-like 5' DNA nuclease